MTVQIEEEETLISCQFCIRCYYAALCFVKVAKIKSFTLIDVNYMTKSRRETFHLVRPGQLQTNDYTCASSLVGVIFEFFALYKKKSFSKDIYTFCFVFSMHSVCRGENNRVECAICSDEE